MLDSGFLIQDSGNNPRLFDSGILNLTPWRSSSSRVQGSGLGIQSAESHLATQEGSKSTFDIVQGKCLET